MTDTTGIKALLEKINTQTNSYDTVIIRDFEAKQLIAAFEAERQRAGTQIADLEKRLRYTEEALIAATDLHGAALKGDHVPVAVGTSEECSPDVYAKGVSACLVDIPKETAEDICRGISAASGVAVDWHYIGGRVHIKAMLFTAPQKLVVKIAGDMPRAQFNYGMYAKGWNDRGLADKLSIEAAGGIVKDGE